MPPTPSNLMSVYPPMDVPTSVSTGLAPSSLFLLYVKLTGLSFPIIFQKCGCSYSLFLWRRAQLDQITQSRPKHQAEDARQNQTQCRDDRSSRGFPALHLMHCN